MGMWKKDGIEGKRDAGSSIVEAIREFLARDRGTSVANDTSKSTGDLGGASRATTLNLLPYLSADASQLASSILSIPTGLEVHREPPPRGSTAGPWDLDVPLELRVSGSNGGRPDIQLQVVGFRWGNAAACYPQPAEGTAGMLEATGRVVRRLGGYVFLQLALPDTWPHVLHHMASIGTCISLSQLAWGSLPKAVRDRVSAKARSVRRAMPEAISDITSPLVAGTMEVCMQAQPYCTPAVILGLAALAISAVHPPTFHVLQCIAAALPVAAGYNQTGRDVALGKIPSGWRQEAAWRARHKWAAQRVAHLMTDLYDRPPLAPLLDAMDRFTFNVGLSLEGQAISDSFGGWAGEGWAAAPLGCPLGLWGSVRLPAGNKPKKPSTTGAEARNTVLAPDPLGTGQITVGTDAGDPTVVVPLPAVRVAEIEADPFGMRPATLATPAGTPVPTPNLARSPPDLASSQSSGGSLGTSALPDGSQHRTSWVQQRVPAAPPGPRLGDPSSGEDASSRAGSRSCGLLPGVDTSAEGFETSLLPTIRNAADLQAFAVGAQPQLNSPFAAAAQQGAGIVGRGAAVHVPSAGGSLHRIPTGELLNLPGSDWEETLEGLRLYGRGDHLGPVAVPTTPLDRIVMAGRAIYLIVSFLPFLLLGPLLLALSALILRLGRAFTRRPAVAIVSPAPPVGAAAISAVPIAVAGLGSAAVPPIGPAYTFETRSNRTATLFRPRRRRAGRGEEEEGIGERRAWSSVEEMMEKAPESLGMSDRLGSMATFSQEVRARAHAHPPASVHEEAAAACRWACWNLLLQAIRSSGAAFIKWGQWSATREDIFPEEFCVALSELHDQAPVHSWQYTRTEIEKAFGCPLEDLFASIEETPLASGSIAQVHRAVLKIGNKRRNVAVKVRHPGVARQIAQDFQLLQPVAALTSKVRSLKGLSIKESLAQFSASMTAQADLRVEYAHLRRFYRNFRAVREAVTPPLPVPGLCTPSVLVETFEPGDSVAKFIREPAPFNTQIVALGVDAYLKMVLGDNFVHTDLHPGNILVRLRGQVGVDQAATADQVKGRLQLVLLDFGLAEELTPPVRRHFISFLHMISKGDGAMGAYHMLKFGAVQRCPSPAAFVADMVALFNRECNIYSPRGINLDTVMKHSLQLARKHEVTVDSGYAALVIGCCVVVGFATALDPNVNLMDAATPTLLVHNLTGRQLGRLYT